MAQFNRPSILLVVPVITIQFSSVQFVTLLKQNVLMYLSFPR